MLKTVTIKIKLHQQSSLLTFVVLSFYSVDEGSENNNSYIL